MKALGVSSKTRAAQLPDVPAIAEKMPEFFTGTLQGLLASKGTPQPVVERLAAEVTAILKTPEMRHKLDELGMQPVPYTPSQFNTWLGDQVTSRAKVIKRNDVKVE